MKEELITTSLENQLEQAIVSDTFSREEFEDIDDLNWSVITSGQRGNNHFFEDQILKISIKKNDKWIHKTYIGKTYFNLVDKQLLLFPEGEIEGINLWTHTNLHKN